MSALQSTSICSLTAMPPAATAAQGRGPISPEEAHRIGTAPDIYGDPRVTMELTRRVMTNVASPTGSDAPMGRFAHLRACPTPEDTAVTAPNADTPAPLAWLDPSDGPHAPRVPDAGARDFLKPMLGGWTDVFQVPGSRTAGTGAQPDAITGPGGGGTAEVNGRNFSAKAGLHGTNYPQWAFVTAIGLGANRPQDALYPFTAEDGSWTPPDVSKAD
ncbi:DUF1254 domain-containing protein [Tautonia plasticadhaerens]|uniref:DUF1254 domain-containing protein n=1 Tax=Tautonia plasticadhaerens TaxID=2527974 RepID=A0A518GUS1_9BACT|nr:DUF1254 domain-containing protein [Tautonia plasticadhaerens]QDV32335.1 hypothetical protein ElP_01630 [Tautonia plasticadhaerens]